jgi:7-alpha-hydroxysteroid dehydrogenase
MAALFLRGKIMALLDAFRLDGTVAIVTAASRGIGAACASALAECGADVVIAARTEAALDEVAAQIRSVGRRAVTVPCDLNDLSTFGRLVDAAVNELGRLDIVVNNVGGSMPGPFLNETAESFDAAFRFNVTTAFELTRLATPRMLERDGGSVINIASAMGLLADRGYSVYGTAKGAMVHMTKLLAADLAPRIRVNAIAPGSIATTALAGVLNDELERLMIHATPMRRLGRVEDIALGVVYLASPASSFVTGKVIAIDGGITFPNLSLNLPDL